MTAGTNVFGVGPVNYRSSAVRAERSSTKCSALTAVTPATMSSSVNDGSPRPAAKYASVNARRNSSMWTTLIDVLPESIDPWVDRVDRDPRSPDGAGRTSKRAAGRHLCRVTSPCWSRPASGSPRPASSRPTTSTSSTASSSSARPSSASPDSFRSIRPRPSHSPATPTAATDVALHPPRSEYFFRTERSPRLQRHAVEKTVCRDRGVDRRRADPRRADRRDGTAGRGCRGNELRPHGQLHRRNQTGDDRIPPHTRPAISSRASPATPAGGSAGTAVQVLPEKYRRPATQS